MTNVKKIIANFIVKIAELSAEQDNVTDLSFSKGIDGLCEIIYDSMVMNKLFGLRTRPAKSMLNPTHFTYRIYLLIQKMFNSLTVLKVSIQMLNFIKR